MQFSFYKKELWWKYGRLGCHHHRSKHYCVGETIIDILCSWTSFNVFFGFVVFEKLLLDIGYIIFDMFVVKKDLWCIVLAVGTYWQMNSDMESFQLSRILFVVALILSWTCLFMALPVLKQLNYKSFQNILPAVSHWIFKLLCFTEKSSVFRYMGISIIIVIGALEVSVQTLKYSLFHFYRKICRFIHSCT